MICKIFKGIWVILAFSIAVWCIGCSGSDDSTSSEDGDDFTHTPTADIDERIKNLKRLLPEATYTIITEGSRNLQACRESNRENLGLSDEPNGQWYYTYENLIKGMAQWEEFANEGDDNTKKLEIAAFLANIAQETGAKNDKFGGPGCFIQEGGGGEAPDFKAWHDCAFGGCNKTRSFMCPQWPDNWCPEGEVGYFGRGPHQLTHDYNYKAFGKGIAGADGDEDKFLKNPDLLTTEPATGIAGSIWFWGHAEPNQRDPKSEIPFKPAGHNVAVGKWEPTPEDIACGRKEPNFGVIINIINGGLECGPGAGNPEAAENRVRYLMAIAEEMGVTIPDGFIDDCSSQQNFSTCPSY